ncbi:MAG: GDP-mannose 4,6-dehydratase [bacterium]
MNNFWKNKRILVTGYEGFLGSNLTKWLLNNKARIIGIDIDVRRDKTILTENDYDKITVIKGNISDFDFLKEIISKYKIEIIFHLAAEAIVERALKDPLKTFSSNIEGTWNILEACRQYGKVGTIIIASSDKAYGSHKKLPYKEDAPLIGNHPYDVSKSCADLIAYAYYHTYNLPVAVTRCGNIYGPGDFNFSRIIPDAIRCLITGETLLIRSDGRFTRDYVYVDDIVNGYVMLAEKMKKKKLQGEVFNFSDENPLAVIKLLEIISALTKQKLNYRVLNKAKYEIKDQFLDSSKARRLLGWKPKYTLKEGFKETIEWYKRYFS